MNVQPQRLPASRLGGTGVGRPRDPAIDRAILEAAVRLFAERGFDGLTLEHVAETAGVARTTVYRRWSSKEALISAAIAQHRGASDAGVLKKSISPAAMLNEVIDALVETLAAPEYRKIVARLVGSVPDHPELMLSYWKNYLLPRRNSAAAVLERARADGRLPSAADPEILLDLIAGAILNRILVQQGDRSKIKLREYLTKVFHALGLLEAKHLYAEGDVVRKRPHP